MLNIERLFCWLVIFTPFVDTKSFHWSWCNWLCPVYRNCCSNYNFGLPLGGKGCSCWCALWLARDARIGVRHSLRMCLGSAHIGLDSNDLSSELGCNHRHSGDCARNSYVAHDTHGSRLDSGSLHNNS